MLWNKGNRAIGSCDCLATPAASLGLFLFIFWSLNGTRSWGCWEPRHSVLGHPHPLAPRPGRLAGTPAYRLHLSCPSTVPPLCHTPGALSTQGRKQRQPNRTMGWTGWGQENPQNLKLLPELQSPAALLDSLNQFIHQQSTQNETLPTHSSVGHTASQPSSATLHQTSTYQSCTGKLTWRPKVT